MPIAIKIALSLKNISSQFQFGKIQERLRDEGMSQKKIKMRRSCIKINFTCYWKKMKKLSISISINQEIPETSVKAGCIPSHGCMVWFWSTCAHWNLHSTSATRNPSDPIPVGLPCDCDKRHCQHFFDFINYLTKANWSTWDRDFSGNYRWPLMRHSHSWIVYWSWNLK